MIGPDIVLPPGVKITLKRQTEGDDFGMDGLSLEDNQRVGRVLSLLTYLRFHLLAKALVF